jgi:hypothetical protein
MSALPALPHRVYPLPLPSRPHLRTPDPRWSRRHSARVPVGRGSQRRLVLLSTHGQAGGEEKLALPTREPVADHERPV